MRCVPVQAVKGYEGVEVCLHALTSALYWDEPYTHAASVAAREQPIIILVLDLCLTVHHQCR